MEVITEGVNNLNIAPAAATTDSANNKKNRIQVSNTKKPLFFYVNLAKVVLPNPPPFLFSKLVFFFAFYLLVIEETKFSFVFFWMAY